ncbi:MAG: DUF4345 domain-containing protein [Actinobacteria bacterium]|uniref:Unannotated protein n=1 Tax=freshwater metagenome TaxID=449393 RepID=A0A6J7W0C1_9ZZZZ|nr:DUF4345 domain-containing protein [Actinomycetota bacterium]MSX71783.1 DUF4345 domain-containing protein [Actinomycetota bacterium]MSY69684.1 DUF4345 domain-containing protein [Actinomycetota bacterium]MTA75859.1 DUF4345 domain-containing protein [Actinomycetota bacterium]
MKITMRTFVLGFTGIINSVLAFLGMVVPAKAFGEDNLSVVILSNLRAFTAAELALTIFSLYSLSHKKYQDMALIFILLTVIGWTVGQTLSIFVDGAPGTFTVGTIIVQALFIPLTWQALKKG